jgi:hypothetical protein
MSRNPKKHFHPSASPEQKSEGPVQLPKVEVNVHIDTQPLPQTPKVKATEEKRPEPFWQKLILTLLGSSLMVALITGVTQGAALKNAQTTGTPTPTATLTATPFPIQPATSTPTPTPSPQPSATSAPLVLEPESTPPACLSSAEWTFFPEAQANQNACLDLVKWYITSDGEDDFKFYAQEYRENNIFGVSRALPRSAEIETTLVVNELQGGGRVWLAITSDPDPRKNTLLLAILPGNYVAIRQVREGVERNLSDPKIPYFRDLQKKEYQVRIKLNGNQTAIYLNGVQIASVAINFPIRRLFVGYQTVRNSKMSISAELEDLVIK